MKKIPAINMKSVGENIKMFMQKDGYQVKDLQEMLFLAHPQPVYRWMQGKVLPSVERLYALSKIFGVHMEELLEDDENSKIDAVTIEPLPILFSISTEHVCRKTYVKRLLPYFSESRADGAVI